MKIYVTDNPFVHKEVSGSFLAYSLFDWQSKKENENEDGTSYDIVFRKKWKNKDFKKAISMHSSVTCIVSPSNYRLLYDILSLREDNSSLSLNFFTWNGWLQRRSFKPNVKQIEKLFYDYMQRGYLGRAMFFELGGMNFQRIEQFIVSLFILAVNKGVLKFDAVTRKRDDLCIAVEKAVKAQAKGFAKAMEKIIYHHRKIDIADPFVQKKISFTHKGKTKSLAKILAENEIGCPSYLQGAINFLSPFIPVVDIYKTFLFLLKNDFIKCDDEGKCTSALQLKKDEILEYISYLDATLWKDIYDKRLYSFSGILPYISVSPSSFTCPACGSIKFKTNPLWFSCASASCNFKIKRMINPLGSVQRLKPEEFKRLVNHGFVFVKNKKGGYSKYVLKKNKDGSYWPLPA